MRKQTHWYCLGSPTKTLLALATAATCLHAMADNLPLNLTVSETLSRDSNLYRVAPGEYAVADTVSSTGLKLGLDKSYGRQRYTANLGTALNRYFDSTKLNNTSYDSKLSITSEFSNKGLISLSGGATQNLARFDVAASNAIYSQKNTQNTSYLNGQISYGGYGLLNPYISLNHFQQGFTVTNSNYQAMNQNTLGVGNYYAVVPQLNLGLGARLTRGNISYDDGFGSSINNNLRRRDIDLSANWVATGLSSLYARLSATHENDVYAPNPNYAIRNSTSKNLTGELNWQYTPQGRLSYLLGFVRDSGNVGRGFDASNTEINGQTAPGLTYASAGLSAFQRNENNRLSNNINGKVTWDLSYKIKINTAFSYTRYHLQQSETLTSALSPSGLNNPLANDKSRYTEFSIGGQYEFARWLNLYCDIRRIKRTRDTEYTPFNSTVTACTGQFNINGLN